MAYFIPTFSIHDLYKTLTAPNTNYKNCILMLIKGIEDNLHPNITEWFNNFNGWVNKPFVLTIAFKKLAPNHTSRKLCIKKVIEFVTGEQPSPCQLVKLACKMIENINPETPPTFRKEKIDNYVEKFGDETKELFISIAGYLLFFLRYKKDTNWYFTPNN